MTAMAVTMMAPPPMPCSARDATSIVIDPLRPHSTEPARKNSTDVWKTTLRPNRSPSLPTIAVTMVAGEQITGDHPGLVAGPTEIGDDGGQRGGHDRLVERGQQHAEQHRNEDEVAAVEADARRCWTPGPRQRPSMPDSSYLPSVRDDRSSSHIVR